MNTSRYESQTIRQTITSDIKRSLSYNDLKKKRLLRSQKSKSKLQKQHKQIIISKTQKKKHAQPYPRTTISNENTPYDQTKQSYNNIIQLKNQLSDVLNQMKQKSKTKKNIISKSYYTDRLIQPKINKQIYKKQITYNQNKNSKKNSFFSNLSIAGDQKNIIKDIIDKKKSQRRLLKLEQIRNQVKKQKSKSKSKEKSNGKSNSKNKFFQNDNVSTSKSYQRKNQSNNKINQSQQLNSKKQIQVQKKTQLRVNKFKTVSQKPQINSQRVQTIKQNQYDSQKYSHKIKLNDFHTQRRSLNKNKQSYSSFRKLTIHRKLKKSSSQIIIKNKSISIKNYVSENENKSFNVEPKQTKPIIHIKKQVAINNNNNSANIQKQSKTVPIFNNQQIQAARHEYETSQPYFQPANLFTLQQMNISSISIQKQSPSLIQLDSCLKIVQQIQQQQIQYHVNKIKKLSIQNRQNLESISNVLDLMILPTQQLKMKIKNSAKMIKKKNQLEKFKKIFPMNFFKKS